MLKEEGNEYFRNGSYKTAIKTYSRALRTCPLTYKKDRAIMYSNRGACKMRMVTGLSLISGFQILPGSILRFVQICIFVKTFPILLSIYLGIG